MSTDRPILPRLPKDTLTSDDEQAHAAGDPASQCIVETFDHTTDDGLPDLKLVRVDQETWDFFVNVLDQPPENAGLTRLLQAPLPWNQQSALH